jgi:hypothetical protein
MSMYTQILDAALRERSPPDAGMTTGEALSVLFQCRHHLVSIAASERGVDWSATALANQVAYDIALIDLTRCVGVDCDPHSFDQPERHRTELRQKLISRGVRLDEFDQVNNSTSERR